QIFDRCTVHAWSKSRPRKRALLKNTSLNRKIAEMPVSWISTMIFVSPFMLMSPEKPNENVDDEELSENSIKNSVVVNDMTESDWLRRSTLSSSFGNILHTGDCRLTPECLQNLPEKYIGRKGKEPQCRFDYVFLDRTFGRFSRNLPSKHSAIRQVVLACLVIFVQIVLSL
ncbi:hypothetical protein Gotur_025178, partial [Gossypium turneri]